MQSCRLENIWIRWHDNSESSIRSLSGVPTTSSLTLPETQNIPVPPPISSSLFRKYGHVEYPSLSILPPLKTLAVLDIDEPSYVEEMAILVGRSRDRLRELRIGISLKVHQAGWLKPLGGSQSEQQILSPRFSGWPKPGGILGTVLGWPNHRVRARPPTQKEPNQVGTAQEAIVQTEIPALVSTIAQASLYELLDPTPTHNLVEAQEIADAGNIPYSISHHETNPAPTADSKASREALKKSSRATYASIAGSDRQLLKLKVLELERVYISAPVLLDTLDWTKITTLTILRCDGHEKLWRALRRRFAPATLHSSSKPGRKEGTCLDESLPEYALNIKHIHTDAVSPYLLLFIKDALRPNTLETVFFHGAPLHDSAVHVEAIYRNVLRNHRSSLRKLLVDSTERTTGGADIGTTRWRKWMFTREMITFMTSGRMPRLSELSMTLDSKDWVSSLLPL